MSAWNEYLLVQVKVATDFSETCLKNVSIWNYYGTNKQFVYLQRKSKLMEPVCELGGHAKERDPLQQQVKPSQPEQILNFQKAWNGVVPCAVSEFWKTVYKKSWQSALVNIGL